MEAYPVTLLQRSDAGILMPASVSFIPPQDVFHAMGEAGLENELLVGNPDELEEYWRQNSDSAWLLSHPGRSHVERDPRSCVGLRLWGDDAVATKQDSLYALSVASVTTLHLTSLLSRILVFGIAVGRFVNLEPLWRALTWALEACLSGVMPSHDHLGEPLTGRRAANAGKRVCKSLHFLLSEFTGDLKFLVETLLLRFHHSTSPEFCMKCFAVKTNGLLSGFNFNRDCGWQHLKRCHAEWMRDSGHMLAVAGLPGFHSLIVRFDLMHCLHLGILPVTLGSIFVELLSMNYWQGPCVGAWVYRWTIQLRTAFAEFRVWLSDNNICLSPPAFTVARLSLITKSGAPVFKGKAGMNMRVARWLLSVLSSLSQASADPHHQAMTSTLWGFIRGVDIFQSAGRFLNPSELLELEVARKAAFVAHATLAHNAISRGSQLWRTLPKAHYVDHIYRCEDLLNPTCGWTFSDEDWIGRLIRINRRSADGDKLVRKYLLRFHMVLDKHQLSAPQL